MNYNITGITLILNVFIYIITCINSRKSVSVSFIYIIFLIITQFWIINDQKVMY